MTKIEIFEEFITENIDNVYRFAFSYTKNQHDAEDVVNESVLKAIKSINKLREPKLVKPWFYKIISNTSLTLLKKRKKITYVNSEIIETQSIVFDDYSPITFESFIKDLDIKYREVIILKYFEDMTFSEIADVLSLNENTVKTRLYRAQKILKLNIQEDSIYE